MERNWFLVSANGKMFPPVRLPPRAVRAVFVCAYAALHDVLSYAMTYSNKPHLAHESTEKRRGRSPIKRENPTEDYPSANACHLAANKECCLTYDGSDFKVLAPRLLVETSS